jgi:hypothetical protein
MNGRLHRVDAQAAAIERGEDPCLAARLGVLDRRVRHVAVQMKRAAAGKVQWRERMEIVVVAGAQDGALIALRHDE